MRLGRYPFAAGIKYFVEKKKGVWRSKRTVTVRIRDLHEMGDTMEALKAKGLISTTDPRHMKEPDIRNYADEIKHLDPDTQGLRLRLLNDYLKSFRNHSFDDMLEAGEFIIPSAGPKPIRTVDAEGLAKIFETVVGMEGWSGSVCRGMVSIYFGTGLRPSELRLSEARDLDLKKRMAIFVRHPKGEGNWASQVWVDIIRDDVLPMIQQYVDERTAFLEENNASDAPALFPCLFNETGFYSESRFRVFKERIAKVSEVDFSLKMFRSALCTITVNEDLSRLTAMSVQLRHSSPNVTEEFYAKIKRGNAGKQLRAAWRETPILRPVVEPLALKEPKHPAIDSKFEVSGYV